MNPTAKRTQMTQDLAKLMIIRAMKIFPTKKDVKMIKDVSIRAA